MAIARKESRYGQGKCKAKCFVDVDFSTSLKQAICEHEGSAGVWIWANLVSLRSVIVHLPWKHVQFCRPKIVFVSLLARCNLLGALGASAGRRRCVFGDVVTTCAHLHTFPRQSDAVQSAADCMLWAVHGPRWSVSDFWWDLCPTAWSAVGSTLHLQQPDWQAATLRSVASQRVCALGSVLCPTHVALYIAHCILDHNRVSNTYGRACDETGIEPARSIGIEMRLYSIYEDQCQ